MNPITYQIHGLLYEKDYLLFVLFFMRLSHLFFPKFRSMFAISAGVLGRLETAEYGTFIFKDEGSITVARKILDLIENSLKAKKEEAPKEEGWTCIGY